MWGIIDSCPLVHPRRGPGSYGTIKKLSNWHHWEIDLYCLRCEWENENLLKPWQLSLNLTENPTEMTETKLPDWKVKDKYDWKNSTVAPTQNFDWSSSRERVSKSCFLIGQEFTKCWKSANEKPGFIFPTLWFFWAQFWSRLLPRISWNFEWSQLFSLLAQGETVTDREAKIN